MHHSGTSPEIVIILLGTLRRFGTLTNIGAISRIAPIFVLSVADYTQPCAIMALATFMKPPMFAPLT